VARGRRLGVGWTWGISLRRPRSLRRAIPPGLQESVPVWQIPYVPAGIDGFLQFGPRTREQAPSLRDTDNNAGRAVHSNNRGGSAVIERTRALLLIPVVAIVALVPLLAAAQELEEIIVTAERRETTVLKTPISLEVFTADALAADQLKSVRDLENATANLTINTTGFTVQSVNIRGIGNSVVNPNIAPGVAVFQDGLLMAETVVLQQGFL